MNKVIDSSLFFSATGNDIKKNLNAFLCQSLSVLNMDNIDPVLMAAPDFDYNSLSLNFASLSSVGDPRFSLGHMLSAVTDQYFPRIAAYNEVLQNGGTSIVDNFICDSEGNKIKQTTTNYGTINMTPLTSDEISSFVLNGFQDSIDNHTAAFALWLNNHYISDGYAVTLYTYRDFPLSYIKLTKLSTTLYFRYHHDSLQSLSDALNIPIILDTTNNYVNAPLTAALGKVIPDYTLMV